MTDRLRETHRRYARRIDLRGGDEVCVRSTFGNVPLTSQSVSLQLRALQMLEGSCLCGQVRWRFDAVPDGATACNCTACRRYGALWIYGHEGEDVRVSGASAAYTRRDGSPLAFHFCPSCGCVTHWRGLRLERDGRRRLAVNLRLVSDPDQVASIPINHFDGLETFEDLPRDGRCVGSMWF